MIENENNISRVQQENAYFARCRANSASKCSLQARKLSTVTTSPWGTMT
jgi:hypothetical protein